MFWWRSVGTRLCPLHFGMHTVSNQKLDGGQVLGMRLIEQHEVNSRECDRLMIV